MRFSSNDPLAKRVTDKELGQIKYQLHQKKDIPLKDIRIKWNEAAVEIKGKRVAWFDQAMQEMTYHEEALEVSNEVKEFMKEWKDKRNVNDDDDL